MKKQNKNFQNTIVNLSKHYDDLVERLRDLPIRQRDRRMALLPADAPTPDVEDLDAMMDSLED